MITETRLVATRQQARELADALKVAADKALRGAAQSVRQVLEQSDDDGTGPWRLVILVVDEE